jgi:hypothetical protein
LKIDIGKVKRAARFLVALPWRAFEVLVSLASAEFLLYFVPNGGSVILARSLWTSALAFTAALILKVVLEPGAVVLSWSVILSRALEHFVWLGAIFGATYAALYSRFASQWTYLAELYNTMMATRIQGDDDLGEKRGEAYVRWCAGFIEDAINLHLAAKPLYASVIRGFLEDAEVRGALFDFTPGARERLRHLEFQRPGTVPADLLMRTKSTDVPRVASDQDSTGA